MASDADNVSHQAGEAGGRALRHGWLCIQGLAGCGPGAAAGDAHDQPFFDQLLECAAHSHTTNAELPGQQHLCGHAFRKAALFQLLAQHQVNLVVFGERKCAVHGFQALRLSGP